MHILKFSIRLAIRPRYWIIFLERVSTIRNKSGLSTNNMDGPGISHSAFTFSGNPPAL